MSARANAGEEAVAKGPAALERVVFFADAVFAIAITLLAVELGVPHVEDEELGAALAEKWPEFFSFGFSFLVIGIWWMAHHRMFQYVVRFDGWLLRLHLLFLMTVAVIPFPTALLAEYGNTPLAVLVYALTMTTTGLLSAAIWAYATGRRRLVPRNLDERIVRYLRLRSIAVPTAFASSLPLVLVHPYAAEAWWAIAYVLIFVIQRRYRGVGG